MTLPHLLVIIAVALSITGSSVYIRDTIKGKTKPNLVSWSMWALAPLISTCVAISAKADLWATARVFFAGFLPLLVVIIALINPKSYWKLTLFDLLCGACSFLAIIVWAYLGLAKSAIILALLGDCFALFPTLKKAWQNPETESGLTYFAGFISSILIIPSIPRFDIENSAFQIYLIIANALLFLAVYKRTLKLFK
ncbi:hypothetical protein C4569_01045 [Candidatus Parcubacteria bacterium]|nr:MAG: hypothetical protein C4569_01045 [Candidatus Parcubacteria bacterium]